MRNVNKTRLFMLVTSLVSAVAVTVGLWWQGASDPFVAVILVALTAAVWAPFVYHMNEAFHYVEGWRWDSGVYHTTVEYNDEPHRVDVYVEYDKRHGRWVVSLRESTPTVYREVAHWHERLLYSALGNGEDLAHRILCEARHNNSPF